MARGGASIRWTGSAFTNVGAIGLETRRAMTAAGKKIGADSERYMKQHAPWTDRTGNARNGLSSRVISTHNQVTIVLYQSVPYGVYLETRWSGKYQIINPTIEVMGPKYAELIGQMMFV